jgi:hypothetical protein
VLRVPSVIVPATRDLLLNPAHPRAAEPFRFDPRLWSGTA